MTLEALLIILLSISSLAACHSNLLANVISDIPMAKEVDLELFGEWPVKAIVLQSAS